jgi:hypothetical protein
MIRSTMSRHIRRRTRREFMMAFDQSQSQSNINSWWCDEEVKKNKNK